MIFNRNYQNTAVSEHNLIRWATPNVLSFKIPQSAMGLTIVNWMWITKSNVVKTLVTVQVDDVETWNLALTQRLKPIQCGYFGIQF